MTATPTPTHLALYDLAEARGAAVTITTRQGERIDARIAAAYPDAGILAATRPTAEGARYFEVSFDDLVSVTLRYTVF